MTRNEPLAAQLLDSQFIEEESASTPSFFATEKVVGISRELIDSLIEIMEIRGTASARLCLHGSELSELHNMIIVQSRAHYCRPHRHESKVETCQVIDGRIAVLIFDDSGEIDQRFVLDSRTRPIVRIGADRWHTVLAISKIAVYHESKIGPFLGKKDSLFAPWAPSANQSNETNLYHETLLGLQRLKE